MLVPVAAGMNRVEIHVCADLGSDGGWMDFDIRAHRCRWLEFAKRLGSD